MRAICRCSSSCSPPLASCDCCGSACGVGSFWLFRASRRCCSASSWRMRACCCSMVSPSRACSEAGSGERALPWSRSPPASMFTCASTSALTGLARVEALSSTTSSCDSAGRKRLGSAAEKRMASMTACATSDTTMPTVSGSIRLKARAHGVAAAICRNHSVSIESEGASPGSSVPGAGVASAPTGSESWGSATSRTARAWTVRSSSSQSSRSTSRG